MSKPVIAVIGSAMMDLTAYSDLVPNPGQTVIGKKFSTGFGGKGANQAAIAALCGAEVFFIGSIGKDSFGDSIVENFNTINVNCEFIERSNRTTSIAHITVDGKGENKIIIIPDADQDMTSERANQSISEIKNLSAVIAQNEINQEVTIAAFRAAKEKGCMTVLNPAPYKEISEELLNLTDLLIPNENEFRQMVGLSDSEPIELSDLSFSGDLIVTLGENGAIFRGKNEDHISVPAPVISVADTTGAGDAFVGAFVFSLTSGHSVELAMKFAIEVASLSVTRPGAQASYPSPGELAVLEKITFER